MSRFKSKAQAATSNSFATIGKNKVTVDDMITRFPDGFTVVAFDKLKKDNDHFYAINIKEDEQIFFFSGSILTGICDDWMEGYESCEQASSDLTAEGGVTIKMFNAKSKANRNYVACEVL